MAGYTYPIESGPNAGDHLLFTAYAGRVAGYTKVKSRDDQPSQEVVGTVQLFLPENIKNTTKQNFQKFEQQSRNDTITHIKKEISF